jgi:hypothetical protein
VCSNRSALDPAVQIGSTDSSIALTSDGREIGIADRSRETTLRGRCDARSLAERKQVIARRRRRAWRDHDDARARCTDDRDGVAATARIGDKLGGFIGRGLDHWNCGTDHWANSVHSRSG